jgi:hypothetical protein
MGQIITKHDSTGELHLVQDGSLRSTDCSVAKA